MSASDFPKALPRILVYEGGKVDDPQDPGGRTDKGITQGTYNAFRRRYGLPAQDVYLISSAEVATIYKGSYWDKVRADELPAGLDFVVFDGSVNSGCGQAGKWLQQALGDHYEGNDDGQIGDKTLQAVEDYGDVDSLIEAYCAHRLGTLKRLRTWPRFGKGWAARIANGQKTGLAWASEQTPPHPVDVTSDYGHRKAIIDDNIKQPPVSQIAAHITTAGGSVATVATQATTQLTTLGDTFAWMKYVVGGFTLASVVAGILVKFSTDAGAAALKGAATANVNVDADANSIVVPVNDAAPPPVQVIALPAAVAVGA